MSAKSALCLPSESPIERKSSKFLSEYRAGCCWRDLDFDAGADGSLRAFVDDDEFVGRREFARLAPAGSRLLMPLEVQVALVSVVSGDRLEPFVAVCSVAIVAEAWRRFGWRCWPLVADDDDLLRTLDGRLARRGAASIRSRSVEASATDGCCCWRCCCCRCCCWGNLKEAADDDKADSSARPIVE